MEFVVAYLLVGLLVSLGVSLFVPGRKRGEFSPLLFLLDGHPISFLIGVALWPLWIVIQLLERSVPAEKPRVPPPDPPPVKAGELGHAVTDLAPGGRVRIGSRLVDAVCDSGIIGEGEAVEVVDLMPTGVRVKGLPPDAGKRFNSF